MAKLETLTPEQIQSTRAYEQQFRVLFLTPGHSAELQGADINPHLDDTLHIYREDKDTGAWSNGLVARIDVSENIDNGVPLNTAGVEIAQELKGLSAVAVVFSRDRDLLPPELRYHNGS